MSDRGRSPEKEGRMNNDAHPDTPITVVAICGSLRRGSHTRMALEIALEGASEAGAETRLIDLCNYDLSFCNVDVGESELPEDVRRLRREVAEAQGILLGTPEYHGGYSGVLKNALDLMGFDEFSGKMVGLVGVSGGALGAAHALGSLRTVARAVHAWVIPEEASIPQASQAFDAEGRLKDPRLEKRVKRVGRQVARFAWLHHSEKSKAFLREWEEAPADGGAA